MKKYKSGSRPRKTPGRHFNDQGIQLAQDMLHANASRLLHALKILKLHRHIQFLYAPQSSCADILSKKSAACQPVKKILRFCERPLPFPRLSLFQSRLTRRPRIPSFQAAGLLAVRTAFPPKPAVSPQTITRIPAFVYRATISGSISESVMIAVRSLTAAIQIGVIARNLCDRPGGSFRPRSTSLRALRGSRIHAHP